MVLALGVAYRVGAFAWGRSLWVDEAMLALNIASRSFSELAGRLDLLQHAPLGFLWAERAAVTWLGVGELQLRVVELAAGLSLLALTPIVAGNFTGRMGTLLATALVAASPLLIYYSNEAKPYVFDGLASLVVIGTVIRYRARRSRSSALLALFSLAIVPWWSLTAVFSVGATAFVLLALDRNRRQDRRLTLALAASAVASVGVALAWSRVTADLTAFRPFWAGSLGLALLKPPFTEVSYVAVAEVFGWTADTGRFAAYGVYGVAGLVVVLAAVGQGAVARLARDGRAWLLTAPILAGLSAALLGLYPVSDRLWLFASPLLIIQVSAGAEWLALRLGRRRWGHMLSASAVLLAAPGMKRSYYNLHSPRPREHARPVVGELTHRVAPGEAVYVPAGAIPAWLYYTTDWHVPDRATLARMMKIARPGGPAFMNSGRFEPLQMRPGDQLLGGRLIRVVIGLSSGRQIVVAGRNRPPDPRWAGFEARRIAEAFRPCGWLFLAHVMPSERDRLHQALTRQGLRQMARVGWTASAERLCWSSGDAAGNP